MFSLFIFSPKEEALISKRKEFTKVCVYRKLDLSTNRRVGLPT